MANESKYCSQCGSQMGSAANFCPFCGAVSRPVVYGHALERPESKTNTKKTLPKPTALRKILGGVFVFIVVCGGLELLNSGSPATESSVPVKSSDPATVDQRLTQCFLPKAQYGQYSSYDGGKSALALIGECDVAFEWEDQCEAKGGAKDDCEAKILILAQAAIKEFGK
jgi:hypothetical protein